MQFQGVFERAENTKYGHVIHAANASGNWKLYSSGKEAAPNMMPGTPIVASLEKKKNSWYYSDLHIGGAPAAYAPPAPPPQYQPPPPAYAPPPYTPPAPAYAPPAYPAPVAPMPRPEPRHFTERCMMITGAIGRALGSGSFAATDIKMIALAADEAWDALEAKWSGLSVARPTQTSQTPPVGWDESNPPPPGPNDYRL